MQLTIYSFLMAVISSSLMIIAIFYLRKTRFFNDAFGIAFMVLMYLMSLFRMLLPIEIPAIKIIIPDEVFLTHVMDFLLNRSDATSDMSMLVLNVLILLSLVVTFVLLTIFVTKQIKFTRTVKNTYNFATQKECELLRKVADRTFNKKSSIKLIKTDIVNTPMSTGLFDIVVIMPNIEYSDTELEMIFIHECTHFSNNDLWLKLLVHIYCCFMWWNPLVFLLKADLNFILEIKCDNAVCRNLDESARLDYAHAVNLCAKNAVNNTLPAVLVASGFASNKGTKRYVYRMNNLLYRKFDEKRRFTPTIIVSLMMVVIYTLSFMFIWQPSYDDVRIVSHKYGKWGISLYNSDSDYIVRQEDGNYVFHFEGEDIVVTEKDYNLGYYDGYPVFDESGRKITP